MARSLKEILRKLADEIEADEEGEKAEQQRKELEDLKAKALSDDDRAVLDRARALLAELDAERDADDGERDEKKDDDEAKAKPKPKPKQKAKADDDEAPPAKPTRPGRKSGDAYDWWVQDDGTVVKLDVARVYDGPDEPDEVELPDSEAEAS